jgi:PEP-CTERM motif
VQRITAVRLVLISALLIAYAPCHAFATALPIGIHIAADRGTVGSSTGEQPELLGPDVTAGVVPISNWNDFVITRFADGGDKSSTNLPEPQRIPTSATPFTLNDSSGAATTAQVTAWSGNNSYSYYGASETTANPNAQLVNGNLGSINNVKHPNHPATFTVSGVPYTSGYDIYVYFCGGDDGSVGIASGSFLTPSVYFLAIAGESPTASPFLVEATSNDPGSYTLGNYAEFAMPAPGSDGTNSAFTVTIQLPYSSDTPAPVTGIAAIELVPVPEPSTLAILLAGLVAVWPIARCRRRSGAYRI